MTAGFGDFLTHATERAFKGLIAGNVQIDEGLGGDVELETIATAID